MLNYKRMIVGSFTAQIKSSWSRKKVCISDLGVCVSAEDPQQRVLNQVAEWPDAVDEILAAPSKASSVICLSEADAEGAAQPAIRAD